MTTEMTTKAESKRDRVRRLLIHPLEADGFRKRKAVPDEMHRAFLDRVADHLSYMSDSQLGLLRAMLSSKGEGSARHFWPCFATIHGWAEQVQPQPLAELPEILRWFRSRAGPEALRADCHVEQYQFWQRKKRPPMARERVEITERATRRRANHVRWTELIGRRGEARLRDEAHAMADYAKREAYVRQLIEGAGP